MQLPLGDTRLLQEWRSRFEFGVDQQQVLSQDLSRRFCKQFGLRSELLDRRLKRLVEQDGTDALTKDGVANP